MESIREFGASRISDHQYLDGLWEDLLSVGLNVAAGAVSGMEGGPAGMATGAAYGGLRAGVQIGVRRLKSEALSRLYKLFESQPKYAYAGAGNSNFKNFANFRKPANNAPRNAKGSGGSGSQGPKMRDVKDAKDKESTGASNARATPVGENGTFWKSINTGSKQLKDQLRSYAKKSRAKTEIRKNGEQYYQFDRMHKGKPGEHLHRYQRRGKYAIPDAEIDPETGAVKCTIEGGKPEQWF